MNSMTASTALAVFITISASLPLYAGEARTPLASTNSPELLNQFKKWTFDDAKVGEAPAGFSTATVGEGGGASWTVTRDDKAPSAPQALLQSAPCGGAGCLQVILVDGLTYDYPDLTVRLRPSSETPAIGGVIFAAKDAANGYVVLVDFAAKMLDFVALKDGKETSLRRAPINPKSVDWHLLWVRRNTIVSKEFFEVGFDGKFVITLEDDRFKAGRVGLVTRGTGPVAFDNLFVAPLFSSRPLSPPAAY
jgi:hypothetical protein